MKLYLGIFLCVFALSLPAYAQIDATPIGANGIGTGNTVVMLADIWAVGNNPAGIAENKKTQVGFSYHITPTTISNFNTFALAFTQSLPVGVLGIQVVRFGDKVYNETKLGLAYAYNYQKINLGLKLNYLQIAQATWGSQSRFAFEFGAQMPVNKQLKFGVHIYNFTQSVFKDYAGEERAIPTTIKAGLAYQPIQALSLLAEIEKTLDKSVTSHFGIAYQIHKKVAIRTGLQAQGGNETFAQFAGLGFSFNRFQLDYALASQSNIGLAHHVGLSYKVE